MNCNKVSFKSYIPVSYYAKNPANGQYVPVLKTENKRKCHGFVVRNLNHTTKTKQDPGFVNYYKSYDPDYRRLNVVRSVYVDHTPYVYLITGKDVDRVDEMAKPIGKAKRDSLDLIGTTKSFEANAAVNDFFNQVKTFLKRSCSQVKNDNGDKLALRVYFDPQYTKNNKLKGFQFVNARFIKEDEASKFN